MAFVVTWPSGEVPVAVEIVQSSPATRMLAVNGRIASLHSVDVRSLVEGRLVDVLVDEGAFVATGADLARIDPVAQQAVLRQAIAALDAALIARDQAQAALERARALGANLPRTALEDASSASDTADQEVARQTALVDQAQIRLDYHTIHAPVDGSVIALNVEEGQTVDPTSVLMTLADMGQLIVETDVDEAYATQVTLDMPAVLRLAGEVLTRAGRVSFVSQQVDAATGGLAVQLSFDDAVVAPLGLTVTANIIVDRRRSTLTVPRGAILAETDAPTVLVVVDGIATRRALSVIDWPAARLIVTEGLNAGDVVIADPADIRDGQAVRAEAR
jgi:RND family efflux transporter MFP subunit